jgi:hypothetical protein
MSKMKTWAPKREFFTIFGWIETMWRRFYVHWVESFNLRTDDTFPTFSFFSFKTPTSSIWRILEINFRFSTASILHGRSYMFTDIIGVKLEHLTVMVDVSGWTMLDTGMECSVNFCHYYILIYHFLATTRNNQKYLNSKMDLVRYPHFIYLFILIFLFLFGKNKIECK